MKAVYLVLLFLAVASSFASAYDPIPLQDICVAVSDPKNAVFVNGKVCKDPKLATPDDFFFSGLDKPGNTSNPLGSKVTAVTVQQIPGLNTLDVSFGRVDLAPHGLSPLHSHPRAAEFIVILEGTVLVGFITSNPENRLFSKVLKKGDVFVFPLGLIHFQFNVANTSAVAITGLTSQNPGILTIANNIFASNPPLSQDILTKAFQLDGNIVDFLQKQSWFDNTQGKT